MNPDIKFFYQKTKNLPKPGILYFLPAHSYFTFLIFVKSGPIGFYNDGLNGFTS